MITSVGTLPLEAAYRYLHDWPETHPHAGKRVAWIGFDTSDDDFSPLRECVEEKALAVRMADFDKDSKWRGHPKTLISELEPQPHHARAVVEFVLGLIADPREFVLLVHCHAGLYRSGAVAHWLSRDLGVEEHETSNRIVVCGNVDPTYNVTFLRLLREAYAEAKR